MQCFQASSTVFELCCDRHYLLELTEETALRRDGKGIVAAGRRPGTRTSSSVITPSLYMYCKGNLNSSKSCLVYCRYGTRASLADTVQPAY